jgi:hypothetical protein
MCLRTSHCPADYIPSIFTTPDTEEAHVPQPRSPGPLLPTQLAFVVQFAAETAVGRGRFVGRIEHVVSGQVAHFQSLDELLACLVRMLTALDTTSEETP